MKFSVEIEGVTETLAMFKGVEAGMVDLRNLGAWKAVASEFRKLERAQFAGAGIGKSGKWKPLSSAYAAIKTRKFHGPSQILRLSGDLYNSLTSENDANHVFQESAQEMVIGSKDKKAVWHQYGTKAPSRRAGGRSKGFVGPVLNLQGPHRGGMPARPVVDFTEEQERQLMKPIQDKLVQLVGNAKLRSLRGF